MTARAAIAAASCLAILSTGCRIESAERTEARERQAETGFRGRVVDDPGPRPDFVLRDVRGREFDFREETEGSLALLFFGYTHCPDVCPVHMSNLAEVKRDLGSRFGRDTKVVFVTVDPVRDTPDRIREWLSGFDPEFIGLRGDPVTIDSLQVALGLPPATVPDTAAAGTAYDVGHGSPVVAFPAGDSIRVLFPFGTRQEDWRHDLEALARSGRPDPD